MKIETHNPKFRPNDNVLFVDGGLGKPVLVLASVQYCEYSPSIKSWQYILNGRPENTFEENELDLFNIVGRNPIRFSYDSPLTGN